MYFQTTTKDASPSFLPRIKLCLNSTATACGGCSEHRRQPYEGWVMHPDKIYGGGRLYYHPRIRMVNGTADKTAACVLLRKQGDMYAFFIFHS